MQYHVAPCNTFLYFATPCETLQYHAAPCNTLSYHAIPCHTMQYHQHHAISCHNMLTSNIMACTGWMALRGTPPHVRVCSGIVQYKFDRNTVQFGKWNEVTGLKLANGAFIILSKSCFQYFNQIVHAIIRSENSLMEFDLIVLRSPNEASSRLLWMQGSCE